MTGRRSMGARLAIVLVFFFGASSALHAQAIEGSLAAELGISADGVTVGAQFSGSAGVGIPLPSIALGIAPGEPVLIVNTDLNIVAAVGGAIESATGGVIPDGAAQSVIRAGLNDGDIVQVITSQATDIVARAVEQQSGGFIPAAAARTVLTTAINGGNVADAVEDIAVDIVVNEARRVLAGSVGRAVQDTTGGFVKANTVEELFNRAITQAAP